MSESGCLLRCPQGTGVQHAIDHGAGRVRLSTPAVYAAGSGGAVGDSQTLRPVWSVSRLHPVSVHRPDERGRGCVRDHETRQT
jgi:hypothetical protein